MPNRTPPRTMELSRVFGPVQIVLSLLLLLGVAGILLLAVEDRTESAQAGAQLSASDSSIQMAGGAARDTLSLNQEARAWLVGAASRRDVQIARALVAQRLNTKNREGILAGELFGQELSEPLAQFDEAFSLAPSGALLPEQQQIWVPKMALPILNVEEAAKDVIERQVEFAAATESGAISDDQDLAVKQLVLSLLVLVLGGMFFFSLWRALRRNFDQAQELLAEEQNELNLSLLELQRLKEFEQDESQLLELIISGSPLQDVFSEIASVASTHSSGRAYRVSIENIESQPGGLYGTQPVEMSWPFEIERGMKTGVVECFAPAESDDSKDLLGTSIDAAALDDIGRRCAELAKIAVSDSWARRDLIREASHDPLTGLLNRAYLEQRVAELLDVRNSGGPEVALVFCDLDRFKLVNDSLGHKAGDILLVNLAAWFSSAVDAFLHSPAGLSTEVVLSRFGGDEFVMVCTGPQSLEAALALGLRVSELSSRSIVLEGVETFTDMSIGIAVSTDDAKTTEQLVRNADVAMYRSKAMGLGGPVLYSGEVEADRVEHIQTNTMLRRAFERDEFRLYLQPIVEFSSGETVGFEGLVRWQHPTLGLLGPGQFLDNVEELGLIGQLDAWMRREAFGVMARLNTAAGEIAPYLSVNITERELQNATFTSEVVDQIRTAGIPPEQVVLELSENAFVDFEGNEETLEELRASGIRIALDDFGTGYSSLMQLQKLPIDIVKLDRAFVSALTSGGQRALGVLEGLLHVIGAVELTLVVEGVETEFEQDVLVSLGCKYAQGYLYGRPAPAMDVLSLFSAGAASSTGDYASS
jgi:diguanylate cyclase (GGDEF)-like protein